MTKQKYGKFLVTVYYGLILGILIIAFSLCGCSNNSSTPTTAHTVSLSPNATANDNFIKQKALETGGDVNKLSPDDKQKLDVLTRGNTAVVLKNMAKN
jgi:hypothetical protein